MFSECRRHGNLMLTVLLYLQVNTIAWNESGEYLLSGADDCHLNIYRPSNRQVTYSLLVHLISLLVHLIRCLWPCRNSSMSLQELLVAHHVFNWSGSNFSTL